MSIISLFVESVVGRVRQWDRCIRRRLRWGPASVRFAVWRDHRNYSIEREMNLFGRWWNCKEPCLKRTNHVRDSLPFRFSHRPNRMEKKKGFFGTFNSGHVIVINEFGLIGTIRMKSKTKNRLSRPASTLKNDMRWSAECHQEQFTFFCSRTIFLWQHWTTRFRAKFATSK